MKFLCEFIVNKKEKAEETIVTKNETGEEIKTTKTVDKDVPYKFALRRPNRPLNDDARLFYAAKMSELVVKHGIMTVAQLSKRFANDGGAFSDKEKEIYLETLKKLDEKRLNFRELSIKPEGERTEEEKGKYNELVKEINGDLTKLQDFERAESSLFEETAEAHARNKMALWWVLSLAYKEENGKFVPMFGDGKHEDRLKKYDEIEEKDDEFTNKVINNFSAAVTAWYLGKAATQEEFDEILKIVSESSS